MHGSIEFLELWQHNTTNSRHSVLRMNLVYCWIKTRIILENNSISIHNLLGQKSVKMTRSSNCWAIDVNFTPNHIGISWMWNQIFFHSQNVTHIIWVEVITCTYSLVTKIPSHHSQQHLSFSLKKIHMKQAHKHIFWETFFCIIQPFFNCETMPYPWITGRTGGGEQI